MGDAPNFNVGITDPLVLLGLANCFSVTFRFVSAQGQDLGDASNAVVVTQLVLDDGVVVDCHVAVSRVAATDGLKASQ